jgi:two-component system, cell cycle sensor histidine kinase and response regulator CckA
VYSEAGRGTTFRVYLPRIGDPSKSDERTPEQAAAVHGSETILVVEDEPGVRSLIQASLESKGFVVLVASNPDEAEAMARQHPGAIHLLLTDVIMPGRNGKVLAEAIGRLRPNLLVLYMSGYTADAIGHQGILDSSVAFLPKPFTSRDLLRKVREVLGSERKLN